MFSLKLFDSSDPEMCPPIFRDHYVQTLMVRLKDLSSWTVGEFLRFNNGLRNHIIKWPDTSRPEGFSGLPDQYDAYPAYQFALSVNEHGRVHGLLIGNTFHIVWLDHDHNLYS